MTSTSITPISPTSSHSSEFENQYVSFWIGDQLLGVPVKTVKEVLNPQHIATAPRARPEIAGLLNLRGQIVTAVNLRRRLGLPDLNSENKPLNVVVRHGGESFSLLVDDVGDVIDTSNQQLEAMPPTLGAAWRSFTTGVFRLEKRLFVIVNVAAILKLGL